MEVNVNGKEAPQLIAQTIEAEIEIITLQKVRNPFVKFQYVPTLGAPTLPYSH